MGNINEVYFCSCDALLGLFVEGYLGIIHIAELWLVGQVT